MNFIVRVQKAIGDIREFSLEAENIEAARKEASELIHSGAVLFEIYQIDEIGMNLSTSKH